MDFYRQALEWQAETLENRRYLHQNAEVGLEMPRSCAYITQKLAEYGLSPVPCGHGVTAELGKGGGKTLLLRADMDALPMPEESGEAFACPTGKQAHACGHDLHAAMLLTAARLLKACEPALNGRVRLMFQPAEETFEGSRDMLAHGVLDGVDGALALHVAPGKLPLGTVLYNAGGVMMSSVDGFRVTLRGKGGHGAYPNLSVDPIHAAVQVYTALEGLIAREANPEKTCVLTVGRFSAGDAPNIIPDVAVLEGTLRTNDPDARNLLVRRIAEVAQGVSRVHRTEETLEWLSQVPPLVCDAEWTERMVSYLSDAGVPDLRAIPGMQANASEDFANIAERVPATMLYLSAGFSDERGDYSAHNPHVRFNEDALPAGAAILAHCAVRYLEEGACR